MSYFFNHNIDVTSCENVSKSRLELRYNKRIKDKFLPLYRKKYMSECVERLREMKKKDYYFYLLFSQINNAISLSNQFFKGKIKVLPQWVKEHFTKEKILEFFESLPTEIRLPQKFHLTQLVLNFMFFCASYGVSWSQYFLFFEDGRNILKKAFLENETTAIIAFTEAIYMVGVTKSYDEVIFRKEMFNAFPDFEKYVPLDHSSEHASAVNAIALFIYGKITFMTLKIILNKLLAKTVDKM
jgi:hypothetical protein